MHSTTGVPSRKRRPASACEYCRRKKIRYLSPGFGCRTPESDQKQSIPTDFVPCRCDGRQPCENCARAKDEPCVYGFRDVAAWKAGHGREERSSYMSSMFSSDKMLNLAPEFRSPQINAKTDSGFDPSAKGLVSKAAKVTHPYPSSLDFGLQPHDILLDTISPDLQAGSDFSVQAPFLSRSGLGQGDAIEPSGNTSAQQQQDGFQKLEGDALNAQVNTAHWLSAQPGPRIRGVFAYNRFFGPSHHINCVYQVLTTLTPFAFVPDS